MNDDLARKYSHNSGIPVYDKTSQQSNDATHDAVFGELNEDGPNYRDVGRTPRPTEMHFWLTTTRSDG